MDELRTTLDESASLAGAKGSASVKDRTTQIVRRKVVIVGIPGVGKSTVVNKLVELMAQAGTKVNVVNYGTVMMEEASRLHGVRSRDDMRKLPIEKQRDLQVYAASKISKIQDEFVVVDTHLFISTREGYWPGMPMDVLQALKPSHLVLVTASMEEIKKRRDTDSTRARDKSTMESLNLETDAAKSFLFASGLICGCPALIVYNSDGMVEDTAKSIINSVFTN
ncbi:MAG: adenylate kinase [Thaumarchaeota archaeon]|nr:adenylate kinase [Nitrososphaerota archaeon]